MFPGRYFPASYFPARYWPKVGSGEAPPPPVSLRKIYRVDQSGIGGDIYGSGQTGSGKQFRATSGGGKVYR